MTKNGFRQRPWAKYSCVLLLLLLSVWQVNHLINLAWLNIMNIAILKGADVKVDWPDSDMSSRANENVEVAFTRSQIHPDSLKVELYQALSRLQPRIVALEELYRLAGQGFDALKPCLLPAELGVQLTQHTEYNEWLFKGLSITGFKTIESNHILVLWWEKQDLEGKAAIPFIAQSVVHPFVSGKIVGVPVDFQVLNADPQFNISAQLQNKRFSQNDTYPYLVNFHDLVMNGVQKCKARYALHKSENEFVYLELWPGCSLDSPSYSMGPNEIFLLIDRFKTTEGCRGTLGVWWNVNVGQGTGGRYPDDWVTQVFLFDSLRQNTSSGRLQFAAYEGGSALLDFVFLLRLGISEGPS